MSLFFFFIHFFLIHVDREREKARYLVVNVRTYAVFITPPSPPPHFSSCVCARVKGGIMQQMNNTKVFFCCCWSSRYVIKKKERRVYVNMLIYREKQKPCE